MMTAFSIPDSTAYAWLMFAGIFVSIACIVVAGVSPAVEGALPAARKEPANRLRPTNHFISFMKSKVFPPGWKPRLYGRRGRLPLRSW